MDADLLFLENAPNNSGNMISQRDWNQNREVKMETTVVEKTVEQTTAPAHTRVDSSESQNQEQVLLPIPLAELEALIRRVVQE